MIILPNTVSTLVLVTTSTANTLWVADYNDLNTTQTTAFMGQSAGVVASATTTTIVGSPASSTERTVRQLVIKNVDATHTANVLVQKYDGTNAWDLLANVSLTGQQSLTYNEYDGWTVYNASGVPVTSITLTGSVVSGNTSNLVVTSEANAQIQIDFAYPVDAVYAQANSQGTYANGTSVVANVSNINFNNTATTNVNVQANGSQTNVNISANLTAIGIPAIESALAADNAAFSTTNTTFGTINSTFGTVNTQITFAQNTATVLANGTLVLSNANINFVNSVTINVNIAANGTAQSNINLTANLTAIGIPAIESALASDNAAFSTTNGTFSTINSTFGTVNTQITFAQNTATVLANGTLVLSNANINFVNSVTINVNIAANGTAQSNINLTANLTAIGIPAIESALASDNAAFSTTNTTFGTINSTFGTTNTQITLAQNTVATYANGALVLANANINFNNSATVNVNITANGTIQTNINLSVNSSAVIASGNASNIAITYEANGQAQIDTRVPGGGGGGSGSYQVDTYANGTSVLSNANLNWNNTATMNVSVVANGSDQVNVGWTANGSAIVASGNTSNLTTTAEANGQIQIDIAYPLAAMNSSVNIALALAANAWMTANGITGSTLNVAALNVSTNIANTGNILVSQNTITGNLTVVQNASFGNITGAIVATGTPLVNNITRVMSGVAANNTANVVLSLTPANALITTLNEAGMYQIEGMIMIGANNSGTNVANIGINVAFGGSATIATIKYCTMAQANGNTFHTNLTTGSGNTSAVTAAGAVQTGSLSLSSKANDYITITGFANVSAAGTVNCNIACQNTTNSNANVMPNSFIIFTKIG